MDDYGPRARQRAGDRLDPNDGMLDDDIDTIQLIGTDPNRTYVTAQTTASAYTPTDGTVLFNKLVSTTGVKSVILNGFTLTQTVAPPAGTANFSDTGVFLLGGVGLLQFHNILGTFDTSTTDASTGATRIPDGPINIVIGDPSTRLKVAPTIRLDSIFNTVIDSSSGVVATDPQINPTVNILVNGELHGLDFVSSTQHPYVDPAQQLNGVQTINGPIGDPTLRYTNPTLSPISKRRDSVCVPDRRHHGPDGRPSHGRRSAQDAWRRDERHGLARSRPVPEWIQRAEPSQAPPSAAMPTPWAWM